jgi:hypothetical protein
MNPERHTSRSLTALLGTTRALLIAGLALLPLSLPQQAFAAATTQTTHAFLCRPAPAVGSNGPGRVVNTSSTASPQPSYTLNQDGCAVIAASDIGFFLTQGFYFGPNIFVQQTQAITASQTTATITLPAYGFIQYIVLEETAGNAVTGGVDIGDSGSATRFASAVALGANATVIVVDSALTRLFSNSGVPAADGMLFVCHTSCNSASINVSVVYGYY